MATEQMREASHETKECKFTAKESTELLNQYLTVEERQILIAALPDARSRKRISLLSASKLRKDRHLDLRRRDHANTNIIATVHIQ